MHRLRVLTCLSLTKITNGMGTPINNKSIEMKTLCSRVVKLEVGTRCAQVKPG